VPEPTAAVNGIEHHSAAARLAAAVALPYSAIDQRLDHQYGQAPSRTPLTATAKVGCSAHHVPASSTVVYELR
jgi:hypothetical protein